MAELPPLPSLTDAEQAAIKSVGLSSVFDRIREAWHAMVELVGEWKRLAHEWQEKARVLAGQVAELQARLDQNSQNSSKPPSQDGSSFT